MDSLYIISLNSKGVWHFIPFNIGVLLRMSPFSIKFENLINKTSLDLEFSIKFNVFVRISPSFTPFINRIDVYTLQLLDNKLYFWREIYGQLSFKYSFRNLYDDENKE